MIKRMLKQMGGLLLMSTLLVTPAFAGGVSPLPVKDIGEIAARFYQNPQMVNNIGDPFILPAQGKFYMYATSGSIGYYAWESEDLKTYDSRKKVLQRVKWANGDYWAPEVYEYKGRYVMLFSARRTEDKSLRIGIAFADKPQGQYKDPLNAPLFDPGYAVIDASLFVDDDGTPYLFYSRDCSENVVGAYHESHSYVVALADDLLSTIGEPVQLTVPDQAWELHSGDYRWNEGQVVVKNNGKYYLYYSANYFASKEYGVGVAVADSPMGPFVKAKNNPLLTYVEKDGEVIISGPGHNSMFMVGQELFTAYHTHTYPKAPSGHRQLNYDRAGFHEDGTAYINGPTLALQPLPYSMLDVQNVAPLANVTVQGENGQGLTDGDYCISPASKGYAFRGSEVNLRFEAAVTADTVILYPGDGEAAKGTLMINGTYEAAIDLTEASKIPGGSQIIHFETMEVTSLMLAMEQEAALGEIIVLGNPK